MCSVSTIPVADQSVCQSKAHGGTASAAQRCDAHHQSPQQYFHEALRCWHTSVREHWRHQVILPLSPFSVSDLVLGLPWWLVQLLRHNGMLFFNPLFCLGQCVHGKDMILVARIQQRC